MHVLLTITKIWFLRKKIRLACLKRLEMMSFKIIEYLNHCSGQYINNKLV